MAPRNDSRTLVAVVCLLDGVQYLLIRLCRNLIYERIRLHLRELCRHLAAAGVHRIEHVLPVQILTSYYEPEFTSFHKVFLRFLFCHLFKPSEVRRHASRVYFPSPAIIHYPLFQCNSPLPRYYCSTNRGISISYFLLFYHKFRGLKKAATPNPAQVRHDSRIFI